MDYKLKKTELTFREVFSFVENVADACFGINAEGKAYYSPQCKIPSIQANFCEYFLDITFLPTEDEEGNQIIENFDKNYSTYMNVDIKNFYINQIQWNSILVSIDEAIDFRKQQLLHHSPIDDLIKEITNIVKNLGEGLDMKTVMPLMKKLSTMDKIDEKALVDLIVDRRKNTRKSTKKKVNTPTEV
jgi:hypothetical protein